MDVLMPRKELSRAVALLRGAGKPFGAEPVLTFRVDDGTVMVANRGQEADIAVTLATETPAVSGAEAITVLPLAPVEALIKSFTGDMVTLNLAERTTVKLYCGSAIAQLRTFDQALVKPPEVPTDAAWVRVSAADLAHALRASYAAATKEWQVALQGIQFTLHNNGLTVFSTDGFRAAWSGCPASYLTADALNKTVLLPQRGVALLRAVVNLGGEVDLTWDNTRLLVVAGSVKMRLPVLSGELPSIDKVMPKEFITTVEINRRAMVEAIARARILGDPNVSRIDLTLGDNLLTVAGDGAHGHSEEALAVGRTGNLEPLKIAISGRFLADALAADPQAELSVWQVSGAASPLYAITGAHSALIVPLRVLD